MPITLLEYRGNFSCTPGVDYSGSHLRAEYGGGLSETETIFPPLLTMRLTYSALSKRAPLQIRSGATVDRLTYIWDFYRARMDAGREPFAMVSPLDGKLYLWEFADTNLEITMVDHYLGTAGLTLRQAYVRGVVTNADGSVEDSVIDA